MSEKRFGTTLCGFCLTGQHANCVPETLPWFGKTWKCPCGCDKGAKAPQPRVVEDLDDDTLDVEPVVEAARRTRAKRSRVQTVAERELQKVLDNDEVRRVVEEMTV